MSQLKIPIKHIDLIFLSMLALLCAIILVLPRNIDANRSANEWSWKKRSTAISCSKSWTEEASSSGDKNNGGGCAHQFDGFCPLIINTDKRNKTHT